MNRYSQYIELLTEETLDHTVGKAVAAAMGVKIKTFAREKYRNGGDTGALLYTFTADVTMEQIIAALTKSGFKAPKNPSINRDHENMRAFTNNAVSPTHIASAVSEHGRGVRPRVEPRETR
jgi:hypothetical protein